MFKNIVKIIYLLVSFFIYPDDIHEYDQILIYSIPTGKQNGEIGDTTPFKNMGGVPPNNFTITEDNLIYICDFLNKRINIYDIKFEFIESIKEKQQSEVYNSEIFKIDKEGNIIAYIGTIGLVKIDKSGKEIFRINKKDLPQEVKYQHTFFIINGYILYYDNNIINIIDKTGKKLNKNEEIVILNNFNLLTNKQINWEINIKENTDLIKIIENRSIFFYKDKIITNNFQDLKDFNNSFGKTTKIISGSENTEFDTILNELTHITNIKLIDYDAEGNSYWRSFTKNKVENKYVVLVCSRYGEIIDCFYNELSLQNIAIAPNGDVYFMDRMPRGGRFLFYKVERCW